MGDHRKNEALYAEAIVPQVPALRREQAFAQVLPFGEIGQQLGESLLGDAKKLFVVPKRIVSIEANRV